MTKRSESLLWGTQLTNDASVQHIKPFSLKLSELKQPNSQNRTKASNARVEQFWSHNFPTTKETLRNWSKKRVNLKIKKGWYISCLKIVTQQATPAQFSTKSISKISRALKLPTFSQTSSEVLKTFPRPYSTFNGQTSSQQQKQNFVFEKTASIQHFEIKSRPHLPPKALKCFSLDESWFRIFTSSPIKKKHTKNLVIPLKSI